MRRSLLRLVTAAAVLVAWTSMPAAEQKLSGSKEQESDKPAVGTVTDGNGNPLPLEENAAAAPQAARRAQAREVQRGQGWWPFGSSLPPYTAVGKRAEAMTANEIEVNGVALLNVHDVDATLRLIPKGLQIQAGAQLSRKDGFYLVKIEGFKRNQQQVDALTAAGAVLGEYLNINTYIAKIPSSSLAAVKALPFVSYVGDYQPAYKISPRIGLETIPVDETVDAKTGQPKPWAFEVTLHKGVDVNEVLNDLARLQIFPSGDGIVSNGDMTVLVVRTAPDALPAIASIPGVKWIAEKTYAQLLASAINPATIPMVLQNNGVFTTNTGLGWKLWNAGIDGGVTAQIVTMMDTGLNTNMEHFSENTATVGTIGPLHRKVVGYDVDGGDVCVTDIGDLTADGGHGTWTSQHAVGSISNMTSSPDLTHTPTNHWDDGIARGAKVYFRDIGDSTGAIFPPNDLGPGIAAAIGKGSYVENNSWGSATNTYTTTASFLDTALFNNKDFVVTVSAGNRGTAGQSTIGSPSTSKNCICVGGNDVSSPDSLFLNCSWDGNPACGGTNDLGSSRGPVFGSNRIKPDIMTYVYSTNAIGGEQEAIDEPLAMCQSDPTKTVYFQYVNSHGFGGTSFAAPEVAGLAALVRDYFMQGFYPSGAPNGPDIMTPSGSLVKAVILASGEDMSTTSSPSASVIMERYSNDVGYGRANLPGVLHIGGSAPFLFVKNDDSLGDGATKTSFYNILGNGMPLKIMMTWYDAAGNALVANADLKVTIGGNVYWGNTFSGGWSTTGGSADATNNTEGVFLDAGSGLPASGTVQVDVIGANDPGGMQYSLVVSGNVASTTGLVVSLDKGHYTCAGPINITVSDPFGTSPVSVTLTSRNSLSAVIDTKVVSCAGSGGVFSGSILAGSGIAVANGGSITATYSTASAAVATIGCQASITDAGFIIGGGCDNIAAGTDIGAGPLFNGGVNEFYHKYFDAGEYSTYTVGFTNNTGSAIADAYIALVFSGAGAPKMSALNGPIHVGAVAAGATAGAVFQLFTDPSATALAFPSTVNLDFAFTAPADGYTTPTNFSHVQTMHANDVIVRKNQCSTFDTALTPWVESIVAGHALNTWKWTGSLTSTGRATVGSENRTDGMCNSGVLNSAAMVGKDAITLGNNFNGNADSTLLQSFQPALMGNGPNGQPYHYVWKWHSFYHASETFNATTGVWGVFYNDHWNNPVNPTGDDVAGFPIQLGTGSGYFYQTIFDYVGTWNWETANTGTPDNPTTATPAPNQIIIPFSSSVTGLATTGTYFAYGHEHADLTVFQGPGTSTQTTRRDIAFDNDNLVYDEYYTAQQVAACTPGTQVGQVALDQYSYGNCPTGPAIVSLVDANGISGMVATVTSPGTGDSEVVTLTGSAPFFSGSLTLSTVSGVGANNGVLFVLPSETISVSYTDTSPAGTSTAVAAVDCNAGDVVYVTNTQVSDNGDNDGLADNNECVTMDISIKNNSASNLTNTKVTIFSDSPNIDLIPDDHAAYGTVGAGLSATNPPSDRFTFHVASAVDCTVPASPPTAKFTVVITADGLNGAAVLQTFTLSLDLDVGGGTTSYTQNFAVDPGWTTGVTAPDNPGCAGNTYTNDFHWCALCGNAGAGYGAWIGNAAFGTGTQNYTFAFSSSTLYSPVFTAGGTSVTMQFREAGRFETGGTAATLYDGGIVQYQLGAGAWTNLGYTTPVQSATFSGNACSPILASTLAWTGTTTGTAWTLTNASAVATTNGQKIQFRWRLGGDVSGVGTPYGGFGVDDVTVTGLRNFVCETTTNTSLSACCLAPTGLINNTAVDPDLCASTGVQVGWAKDPDNWGDSGAGTRTYDVLRDSIPIVTGIAYATTTYTDATAVPGTTYTYSVRYNDGCGGTTTTSGVSSADSTPPSASLGSLRVSKPTLGAQEPDSDATISWGGSLTVELIRGDLTSLRSSAGVTNVDATGCLVNNLLQSSQVDNSIIGSGASYYLMQNAPFCSVLSGTFSENLPSEKPGAANNRDGDIGASPNTCP